MEVHDVKLVDDLPAQLLKLGLDFLALCLAQAGQSVLGVQAQQDVRRRLDLANGVQGSIAQLFFVLLDDLIEFFFSGRSDHFAD